MGRDVFDVLDVSLREDSYSSLLVHVFRRAPAALCRAFERLTGQRPAGAPIVKLREGIGAKPSRNHPDIFLEADTPAGKWWLVIEAKVQSGEGWEQTRRYAEECREAQERGDCAGYTLMFLTLTGEPPESESWRPLKHRELAEILSAFDDEHVVRDDKLLGPLWAAYWDRLRKYEAQKPPSDDDRVLEWLTPDSVGFVTRRERASLLGPALTPHGYQVRSHMYAGIARESFLVLAWKPYWQTGTWDERSNQPLEECIFAHFELEVPLLGSPAEALNAKCRLHCEVNPYRTAKEIRKCGARTEGFLEFMECFGMTLHQSIRGTRWKRSNHRMQKAWLPCPIGDSTTVGDFRRSLAPELAQVQGRVSMALVTAAKECGLAWWKRVFKEMEADRQKTGHNGDHLASDRTPAT